MNKPPSLFLLVLVHIPHFLLSSPLILFSALQSLTVGAQTAEPGLQTPLTLDSAKSVRAQHEEAVQ